jgi:16S rRNA (cytosine1402-N4)-methyltransferase
MIHKSVLLNEVIKYLSPQKNENFIDGTLGGGGHSLAILEKTAPEGKILAFDLSGEAITAVKQIMDQNNYQEQKERIIFVQNNFVNLSEIIKKHDFQPVNGVLLDLGLSSDLLEKSGRGFSFQRDEFLDMRFGESGQTAYELISQLSHSELEKIFREYGEEKFAEKIAFTITRTRRQQKIKTTFDLKKIIIEAVEEASGHQISEKAQIKIFARIFQALRIAVNNELENLEKTLEQIFQTLLVNGRVVIISYHSLEDRIVKNFFRQQKQENRIEILTKKPIGPSSEELRENYRSRSAKLRAARKM